MNQLKEMIKIEDMIYEIRGKQVMLDRDLAKLYGTETKRINEAVTRNKEKFPERFSWKLTEEEAKDFWSQFATANVSSKSRSTSRVFTEQGVAMLATILKTPIAVQVTIQIMDAFVGMKKYISNSFIEQKYINKLVLEDHERINLLEETFNKLEEKTKVNSLFFEGQIYDAYSLLMDILNKSKEEIIIIDNYAGRELLDILKDVDRNIIIVSKNINDGLRNKYISQYKNIDFIYNNSFHDRFIIIDKEVLYHCGSSFKDLGKKCFAINKMDNNKWVKEILLMIND